MDIDMVAEALTRLDIDPLPDGGTYRLTHEDALNVAQAAIDALQLKEERSTAVVSNNIPPIKTGNVKPAKHYPIRRLVSPWVRAEEPA